MMNAWLVSRRWIGVVGVLLSIAPVTASATPPANDTCAGAQVITAFGPFPFLTIPVDISQATTTGDFPFSTCGASQANSVWYTFTPAQTGSYTLSTAATHTATTVDKTMVVVFTSWDGCAGPAFVLPTFADFTKGCASGGAYAEPGQAIVTAWLETRTQYFIGIWTVASPPLTPQTSTIQMQVQRNHLGPSYSCGAPLTVGVPRFGTTWGAGDRNSYRLADSACFTGAQQTPTTAMGRDVLYSFTAPATDLYEIKVAGAGDATNPVLYVPASCPVAWGAGPLTVACLAASNRSAATTAERLVLNIPAGETRYIVVDDTDEFANNLGLDYHVQVTPISLESEPNDTPATADSIVCGIGLDLGTNSDADFFSLGAVTDQSRLFAMVDGSAVNNIDIDMRLVTATDTLEYDRAGGSFPFGEGSPAIAGAVLSAATPFLRVNRDEADQIIPGYRLYSVVQPSLSSATTESEPNDTTGTSDAASNNYFSGTLSGPAPSIDVDQYRTDANAGDAIFVALDGDPLRNNTAIVAKVALLAPDGHMLAEVHDLTSTSSTDSGAGSLTATTPNSPAQALLFHAPVTGTYFVRVEIGTESTGATGTGDYLLSISKNCSSGGGSSTVMGIDTVSPPAGITSGGQTITLTGNFEDLASVTFGTTPAAILTSSPTQITVTSPSHSAGVTSITLTPTSGGVYVKPNAFAYLSTSFTDAPLVAAVTKVKEQHVTELRPAVDALRLVAGLIAVSWTDLPPTPPWFALTKVRAMHIQELRTLLEDAAARLGYAPGTFTDPALGPGTVIRSVHVEELRQRIEAIAD